MINLPQTLPSITELLPRDEITIQQGLSELFPKKGQRIGAAQDEIATTLDSILAEFSEVRRAKALEKKPEEPEAGIGTDFRSYDYLIICDGSVDADSGAMGVGLQIVEPGDPKKVLGAYSYRLKDGDGKDYCGTSPVAELVGLIYALYIATFLKGSVVIGTDSKNSVQWVNGKFKVNEDHVARLVAYALHWRAARSETTDILEVSRTTTDGVDELARKAIGKGDRPERLHMTVREFTDLLSNAGIENAAVLAAPQKISVDPGALEAFLKARGITDDVTQAAVQAVKEKADS